MHSRMIVKQPLCFEGPTPPSSSVLLLLHELHCACGEADTLVELVC